MKGFILGVVLTFTAMSYQQAKPVTPQAPQAAPAARQQPAPKPEAGPVIPDADKVKILGVLRAADKLQMELQGCQAHQWQIEFSQVGQQLQVAVDAAYKDASVKKEEYDLNTDQLVFVKKVPGAPAKPEEKKN